LSWLRRTCASLGGRRLSLETAPKALLRAPKNHDATPFYNSRLYDELPKEESVGDLGSAAVYRENPAPESVLDAIICRSAEQMVELPDASVHLMVTSPPYNVGKEYDADLTLAEYRAFLRRVWAETSIGRFCAACGLRHSGCWFRVAGRASTWRTWAAGHTCRFTPTSPWTCSIWAF